MSPFNLLLLNMIRSINQLRAKQCLLSALQANELLNHPHLQPYISMVYMKLESPRRSTFPPGARVKERRRSFSNDRRLNPSVSDTEAGSVSSSGKASHSPKFNGTRVSEVTVGVVSEEIVAQRQEGVNKQPGPARTPRVCGTSAKASVMSKRHEALSSTPRAVSKHELVRRCFQSFFNKQGFIVICVCVCVCVLGCLNR